MEDVSALVAKQYEAFAYPEPFADLEEAVHQGYHQLGDPALFGPILWPQGRPQRPLNILVAGCGTIQAAYLAFMNANDRVVGFDLSAASLAHERLLQERHQLHNLKLFKGDLLEVGSLSGTFDVIFCTGVLHHLADPQIGLGALRGVLAPDGVMVLMLYGQTVRTGVYMLQDAFRRMGIKQQTDGVGQVRRIIGELPSGHFAQEYIRAAAELKTDSAIVDTFLHPQDRAFTVTQVLDLLDATSLSFQGWLDNQPYWRNGRWGPETQIAALVDELAPDQHWAVVEMLGQSIGMHAFVARHLVAGQALTDFGREDWRNFVPHPAPHLSRKAQGLFQRGRYEFKCSALEQFVLDGADGRRTIGEIIDVPALEAIGSDERDAFARRYFEHLWKLGHVMISLP